MVGISAVDWLRAWPDLSELCRRGLAGEPLATTIEILDKALDIWWTPEFTAGGEPNGGTGLIVDVSEVTSVRRDAERACTEAVELAQLRSDFIASVSHNLRSPLTSIIGYGELLEARWAQMDDAQRQERLGRILSAAHRQQRLVEDLLSLSRLDAALPGPRSVPVDVQVLIRRVCAETAGTYPGQRFVLDGPSELHALGDRDRIMQILANMVDNAVKYSPVGSPVTVTWSAEAGVALIRVRDGGSGVPEEYRARLFTRFGRIPGSRTRPGQISTGLGLYLAREHARAMGGDLELESTAPEGSVFRLRLLLPQVR
jgi:signal transduction histidine kinase